LQRERGNCAFPCFRRGRVWAEPWIQVKGRVPCGFLGQRPKPSESLQQTIICRFSRFVGAFFGALGFHRLLDTTTLLIDEWFISVFGEVQKTKKCEKECLIVPLGLQKGELGRNPQQVLRNIASYGDYMLSIAFNFAMHTLMASGAAVMPPFVIIRLPGKSPLISSPPAASGTGSS
jgi:hypothetical protein